MATEDLNEIKEMQEDLTAKVNALGAKVDRNHQTVMDAIAKAHAEQMVMLESMNMKNLGRSPNQ